MHFLLRGPYAALGAVAECAAAIAPNGRAKWQRALHARRGLLARYRDFAPRRDHTRPLVWLHGASVGESLQALPVLQRLRTATENPQVAFTWFSPSAEAFADRFAADFRDYLPFDTVRAARATLGALRPTALVFAKVDVWPVLTHHAASRGVKLGLVSATVREDSARANAWARRLLRSAYGRLDLVGAIGDDDADRLVDLGVRRDAVRVTGDTRYDQAWERARKTDLAQPPFAELRGERPTLIAGSTWPADESALQTAWLEVRRQMPLARLIAAPHEPSADHLAAWTRWGAIMGLRTAFLGGEGSAEADVVVVDRMGILGDLYALGDVAFVGGGFHSAGLHSVVEPAAHGRPVLFGPQSGTNADAGRLLAVDAAILCQSPRRLADALVHLLSSPAEARRRGNAAASVVQSGVGAADRSVSLVRELLGQVARHLED
jgi:3-deoxy-D-manno-octulosonic-acid transferase